MLADVDLDRRACDRARRSRDARFDGRFFIGVTTTRIYCRPVCPARAPKDEHIRYFATAAAAQAAGFRPCLRCRPEAAPGTPAWFGTSGLVSRALRLIGDGALDEGSVEALADRLGVTGRHLRRLFLQHLGATPLDVALTRRVHFAKKLLDETSLAMSQVAYAAGFGSLRRFNSQIRQTYTRTPTELRRLARRRGEVASECYRFRLSYRPPYDWDGVLAALRSRATIGVEAVDAIRYRRVIATGGQTGVIEVSHLASRCAIALEVRFADPRALLSIVERVRRLFDLGADPIVIGEHLRADARLRGLVTKRPGMRVPGAWESFEAAVLSLLELQLAGGTRSLMASARPAPTAASIAGRLAALFGTPAAYGRGLERVFPTASQLVTADLQRAGLTPGRAATLRALAGHVAQGTIVLGGPDGLLPLRALAVLPGLDARTAEYVAMRASSEPDAFPVADRLLRRSVGVHTATDLERRSEIWRPWRAYAAMWLLHSHYLEDEVCAS